MFLVRASIWLLPSCFYGWLNPAIFAGTYLIIIALKDRIEEDGGSTMQKHQL